ncbi:hypothetical protein Dimus_029582 [Dionaea muscipula]
MIRVEGGGGGVGVMEEEEKIQRGLQPTEPELVLQWGKRLRCVRVKNPNFAGRSNGSFRRKITSRIVTDSDPYPPQSSRLNRVMEESTMMTRTRSAAGGGNEGRKSVGGGGDENGNVGNGNMNGGITGGGGWEERGVVVGGTVWPKLYITLSSKEKQEDFMAMKGCKLPQRPKKRAKFIQRTLLLVSPGAWLSDMCQDRYQVREKKASSKKKPRGLKALGSTMDSDSD